MRKVISIFTPYLSQSMGGIENLSFNLFNALRNHYDVWAYSALLDYKEQLDGVYYSKYYSENKRVYWDIIKAYRKKIKTNKNHINIGLTWNIGIILLIFNVLYKIPYIIYVHGNDIYPNKIGIIKKILLKTVLKNSEAVIANSYYTKELCSKHGDFNIKVIHPGIIFEGKTKNSNYDKKKEKVLFSLGRLVKRKGFDNVLRAMPRLIFDYPDIHYYIGGKGEYESELRKITEELGLEKHVTFLGFLTEAKKEEMYRLCDLFVMPSYEVENNGSIEGFGIVYLEANSYGKFVIGGNSGGTKDAIVNGTTGLLVDGTNSMSIYEGINNFISNYYGKKSYCFKCIEWAQAHSWDKIVMELLPVIEGGN